MSTSTYQVGSTLRSLLLRVPFVYQGVQTLRDRRQLRRSLAVGSFAQQGEDVQLLDLLKRLNARGPYLDLGANHPFKLSNTYLLYREGWRGVCVDPLPRFRPLYRHWRPADHFICAAIGEEQQLIDLHQFEWDPLSTLDAELAAQYMARGFKRLRKFPVEVRPVDDILGSANITAPLSLLSIDIEGHELSALRSMNLAKWQPAVICMEVLAAHGVRNWQAEDHLLAHGYVAQGDIGHNAVFVRQDLLNRV